LKYKATCQPQSPGVETTPPTIFDGSLLAVMGLCPQFGGFTVKESPAS